VAGAMGLDRLVVEAGAVAKAGLGEVLPGEVEHGSGDVAQRYPVAEPRECQGQLPLATPRIEDAQRRPRRGIGIAEGREPRHRLRQVAAQYREADIPLQPVVDVAAKARGEVVKIAIGGERRQLSHGTAPPAASRGRGSWRRAIVLLVLLHRPEHPAPGTALPT